MPIRDDRYPKMIDAREPAEHEARRGDLRRWLKVLAVCLLWQLAGAGIVVLAFHLQMDHRDALELLWAGFGIAAAGTVLTIAIGAPRNGRGE